MEIEEFKRKVRVGDVVILTQKKGTDIFPGAITVGIVKEFHNGYVHIASTVFNGSILFDGVSRKISDIETITVVRRADPLTKRE